MDKAFKEKKKKEKIKKGTCWHAAWHLFITKEGIDVKYNIVRRTMRVLERQTLFKPCTHSLIPHTKTKLKP